MAINLFLGTALIADGSLLHWLFPENSLVATTLLVIGAAYGLASFLPFFTKVRFVISDTFLAQEGRFVGKGTRRWDVSEIEAVRVYEVTGPFGTSSWRVAFTDQMGDYFPGEFHLEDEERARDLARYLNDRLRIVIDAGDHRAPRPVHAPV
jgi:hypothetical protein